MRKLSVIAIIVTFCLTSTLFSIPFTRSATNPYNPWLDSNDDGIINMRDIAATILSFNTYGDTTKNVSVTNFPQGYVQFDPVMSTPIRDRGPQWSTTQAYFVNIPWNNHTGYTYAGFYCGGFSTAFIHLSLYDLSYADGNDTSIYVSYIRWNVTGSITWEKIGPKQGNITVDRWPIVALTDPPEASAASVSCILELKTKGDWAQYVIITAESSTYSGWAQVSYQVYLRNN